MSDWGSEQADQGIVSPSGAGAPEPTQPYGQPASPYGGAYGQPGPSYQQPTYGQPTYGQPAYGETPPPPAYSPPLQQPAYGQPVYGQPVYGQQPAYAVPGYDPYQGAYRITHPSANTALTLGIISIVGLFLCQLLLILGPFAWVAGAKARRETKASPGQYAEGSAATTGMVLGIVSTVLLVLGVVGFTLLIVAVSSGSSSNL